MNFKNHIQSGLNSLFGQFKWQKPIWLSRTIQKSQSSPKTFWVTASLLVLGLIGINHAIYWYQNRPKPVYITASITAPNITPNAEVLQPNPLILDFGIKNPNFTTQSVAPIDKIGKVINQGVTLTPNIPGKWSWNNDSQLVFTPGEDWPADQTYRIHFEKDFFNPKSKMESYDYSFYTQPFRATISEFKYYQDPVNPKIREAVATIQFNYSVDPTSLESNTKIQFEALKNDTEQDDKPVKFTYTFDPHKRIAYLHTETIDIKNKARYLLLTLGKKVSSSQNKAQLNEIVTKNVMIPDSSNVLRVVKAAASILRNDKDRPEQVLSVETSIGINEKEFNQYVHFYLLPVDYPASATEKAKPNYAWTNPGEVTDAILVLATPLPKQSIPTEQNYSTLHSFKFSVTANSDGEILRAKRRAQDDVRRYIYVKIDKGMKGYGDFTLSNSYGNTLLVPELPKEISFLHKGSLLALSGEKKFSVLVRGVPAVKFDFARVLPNNINQLVTQTQGDFNNPYFSNYSAFNQQNISQISTEIRKFETHDLAKQQYTALDLGNYLTTNANTFGPQGLFLIQATGWDPKNNTALDVKTSRLILITDLGLLVKDNYDETHDVFVQSITKGTPVEQVKVSVLGKNGLEIVTRTTDAQGRAHFPNLKDFVEDKEPTVYLAGLGNDVSFIPYRGENRSLNLSKFDIGGIYTANSELQNLTAYLFSDRGFYRPGDSVHVGMIVKQTFVQPQPAGLPLQATVSDPRGNVIKTEKLTLNDSGYMDLDFKTEPSSQTGQYRVDLTLMKDDLPQNLLGSVTVRVEEFQPDRMRIQSAFIPKPNDGWISPSGLKTKVVLMNLYGKPATNRRISGKISLIPKQVQFAEFPDYVFLDPLQDPKKPAKVFSENLTDLKTNAQGEVEFNLNLERFQKATYDLTFFAEGFEADGGVSVTTQSQTLVSPLPYFIGYKADGDLSFIKQNAVRSVDFIAVNPQLTKEEVKDLQIQLVSLHPVSTLVKKADGTYQYQSIIQSTVVSTNPFTISAQGINYSLPTQTIGDYSLRILNTDNTILNQLKFSVVGASQSPLSKNAELSIKLNKDEFHANEDIQIQITAPYTGSGLITIERDKVYASQWFKTQTTNSIQTIHIPADFQGNGYVNVAFIRDWSSPELFISPLSYSVAPFEVNHDAHDIKITLNTPKVAKPGESFDIEYQSDKPGKIIVFAVDEGILQVSRYETPDPLAFFFQKLALQVNTQQTVDQILPQFIQSRELSAVGGDGNEMALARHLNPFKRKTDLPVVFWSGILDTNTTSQKLSYTIPDYFNGTLRVMAVAASADSVGSQETSAQIRGDFIINPNVPTFVTPSDEFEITASVANNVKDSGEHAQINVELNPSSELELMSSPKQSLEIAEGREQVVHFKLRAKSLLGAAKVTFKATYKDKTASMSSTLSVRPVNPFSTSIRTGLSKDSEKTFDILQTLYPEYRSVEATVSSSPLILIFGLQRYLDNFPYGCTEQLTSKAFPLLAMNTQTWFAKDSQKINDKVNETIQMLSQRQMSNGGFSYWPGFGENPANQFISVYAMHFLTEAKSQGFTVPDGLFSNGLTFLKDLASKNPADVDGARIQSYAIYILTANEIVTTNDIANLMYYLNKDPQKSWQHNLIGAYIAGSLQMLKSSDDANELIRQYQLQTDQSEVSDFFDAKNSNAQYLYIVAKHFPSRLKDIGEEFIKQLVSAMNNEEMNTIFSGYASLALSAYQPTNIPQNLSSLSMSEITKDNQTRKVPATEANYQKLPLGVEVKQIRINNPGKASYFYQIMESGFNKSLPTKPLKQKMEIFREYKGMTNNVTYLGDELEVHLQIRALDNLTLTNIAIEDLLPGGFEVVKNSVKIGTMDYFDVREDRVNFFGSIDQSVKEISYKIKATNTGKYQVPPAFAEAMYDPEVKAQGVVSEIIIKERPNP